MRQKLREPTWFDTRWDNTDIRNDFRRRWDRLLNRAPFPTDRDRILLELAAEHHGSSADWRDSHAKPPPFSSAASRHFRRLTDPQLQVMLDCRTASPASKSPASSCIVSANTRSAAPHSTWTRPFIHFAKLALDRTAIKPSYSAALPPPPSLRIKGREQRGGFVCRKRWMKRTNPKGSSSFSVIVFTRQAAGIFQLL
jgi:hypothetical protein